MRRLLLAFAVLGAGCAGSPPENIMKLDLETTTIHENDETHVSASLRNGGGEAVTVLLEPQLSHTSARLKDDRGTLLESRDNRAMQGSRGFEVGKIKVRVLQPGEALQVEVFALNPFVKRAWAGDMSWDLKDVRSRTLTLEMIYEVTEEGAQNAAAHRAPQVAVGTWTSKPVSLAYRK